MCKDNFKEIISYRDKQLDLPMFKLYHSGRGFGNNRLHTFKFVESDLNSKTETFSLLNCRRSDRIKLMSRGGKYFDADDGINKIHIVFDIDNIKMDRENVDVAKEVADKIEHMIECNY